MSLKAPGSMCNNGFLERIKVMFLPISRNITVSPVVMMDMLLACRSSTLKSLKVLMNGGRDMDWMIFVPTLSSCSLVRLFI